MNSPYTIPTIPQNLGKQETIVQIVEVLDHLNAITQDIFSKVNNRIKENSDKLTNISKRVDTAASKVEQLKGDKKAKTVFSSSKYPAVDVNRDYVSIFKNSSEIKLKRHEVKHIKYVSTYEPLTKLQFYHVKLPEQKNEITTSEGLGDVPSDIKCVNDLLLFNSGKNMYTDFSLTNSLKATKPARISEYNTTSELGAAPNSISQRSSLQQTNKENYFYTPKAEELPALDVPLDLPDLPGIADDLRFELEFGASIAPSAANKNLTSDVTLDLPSVMEIKASPEFCPPPPPPPPPPLEDIPEPPVLKLPTISTDKVSLSGGPMVTSETTVDAGPSHIPKPPSPPPITIPPPIAAASPPQIDSRANLMDAIRKAGGAQNLKKTTVPKTPTNKSAPSGGDLMADLHSKLMMRRKGISGAKNAEQGIGGNSGVTADSTLARMSSMIPPPASKSDVESSVSTDDEEWND